MCFAYTDVYESADVADVYDRHKRTLRIRVTGH